MPSLFYVPFIFAFSTFGLYLIIFFASGEAGFLSIPSSFDGLQEFATKLREYSREHELYVFILFCSFYIWKQSFAIPGSFFLNLLAGSLYGLKLGLPLVCFLTAIGSSICYLLSKFFAKDAVKRIFTKQIDTISKKITNTEASLLVCLISFRMIPMTPNWMLNICSPIVGVPLHLFFLSLLIGLLPYNFLCVHSGTMLADIHSTSDVLDTTTMVKLFLVALFLLIPSIATKVYKRYWLQKVD